MTQDIDICAVISDDALIEAKSGILDIIQEVRPVGSFDRIKERAIKVSLFGHPCNIISLEDLIEVKKSMVRPKDKATLRELEELKLRMKKSRARPKAHPR